MIVPDQIRKCVGFIGYRMADGSFGLAGSMFFLGKDIPETKRVGSVYGITAKHVIDNIRKTGLDRVWLRLNLKSGEAQWFETLLSEWFSHPSDPTIDVAIRPIGLGDNLDHLVYPHSLCVTDEKMNEHQIGLGDEVFITGLFRHHHGSKRNIPIVRVGNLACMTEERITTSAFGEMDAYLIEARSIGGLSGSPVFLNLGLSRVVNNTMRLGGGPQQFLFGLIHGHYDVKAGELDATSSTDDQEKHVNTGIAMVVPMHNIFKVVAAYEASKTGG